MVLTRISTVPASPMRVMVTDPANGDLLNSGGTFYFAPDGEAESSHQVSEHFAKVVMGDPSLAEHFRCDELAASKEAEKAADKPVTGPDQGGGKGSKSKPAKQQGGQAE